MAKATTRMLALGNKRFAPKAPAGPNSRRRAVGFTLIELLLVVAIVGMAASLVSLSLRDPNTTRLEQEAARLVALLEAARAESRTAGVAVSWSPVRKNDTPGNAGTTDADFRFVGLPASIRLPVRWLDRDTSAETLGTQAVVLGPEPILRATRVVLRLGDRRLELITDGLAPFAVANPDLSR